MKKYLRRRGQAAVEFALLLPIFALVLFSTIYIGFFVLDYVTLDNAAAQAARNAVKNGYPYNITTTDSARIKAIGNKLFLTWYELNINCAKSELTTEGGISYVTVTIRADLKSTKRDTILADIMPEAYTVSKTVQIEQP
ncbi:MAG: pilus assembly protein [Selenomonadaceae bacterium]|nr:pilus assembly protein [Selenomonadaceae bacterium]MBQ6758535.1 pilus assembly protein [Selenomonadaceae bacterium]